MLSIVRSANVSHFLVFAADVVHADDTPLPVLAPGRGKTKTARLWTYVRDERPAADDIAPAIWFAYSPNRNGEHPQQHRQTSAAFCRLTDMRALRKYTPMGWCLKRRVGLTLGDHPINRIHDLLPWNLQATNATALTSNDAMPKRPP
jgi:hypothetical protein